MERIISIAVIIGLLFTAASCVDLSIGATDNQKLIKAIEEWKGDYESGDNKFSEKDICQYWTFKTSHIRFKHGRQWLEADTNKNENYGLNFIKDGDFIVTCRYYVINQIYYETKQYNGKWLYQDNTLAYAIYQEDGRLGYVSVFEVIEVTKNKLTLKAYVPNEEDSQVLTLVYERQ